jgi:hypothetical protein
MICPSSHSYLMARQNSTVGQSCLLHLNEAEINVEPFTKTGFQEISKNKLIQQENFSNACI